MNLVRHFVMSLSAALAASAHADSFSIADFGAEAGGAAKCTAAFARAVDAAAEVGGRVVVPPGEWLTGAIELKSGVTLHVEKGATVVFTDDPEDYPDTLTAHEGRVLNWPRPLIGAKDSERVGVTGEGLLTCRTERWWSKDFWNGDRRKAAKRPHFMTFDNCRDVTLDGFTLRESPCWTIHLFCVDGAAVRNLDVAAHGPNCDGIDIESSCNVLVEKCRFDQGDDAICIKSGRDAEGRRRNRPSQDILIRDCTVAHGHTLLGIGSELSGGIRNVRMENCRVDGEVWRFLRVKTNPARGGFVENVAMENVNGGTATKEIFALETDYFWKQESKRNPEIVHTRIKGIYMKDVVADSAERIERRSVKYGPPPEDVVLENVRTGGRPLPKDAVPDALQPPNLKDVRVNGPIGAKFDMFMHERCLSKKACEVIVGEAREAFAMPDDDVFRAPLGMWKGEFWGKLMISAARVAEYKDDEEFRTFLRDEAHRLISYQRPDGYLGTYVDPEFVSPVKPAEHCWNLWCRKYTMWGLLMVYMSTGDKEILDAASRAMKQQIEMLRRLGVRLCDTGTYPMAGMPSCSILKPLVMLYRETGDALFLDYAKEIVSYWDRPGNPPPNFFQNVETGRPVSEWYVEEADRWGKAYEMMSCLDGVLEFYRLTGEERCLEMVKKMQDNLWKTERNPLEGVGYNDRFTGAARHLNGTSEPCDTIHWMRLNLDLYLITGEKRYADVFEAAFYNAFLAGVFRDGKWGAREVRSHGRHVARFGQSGMRHQHCCVNNMPRAFMDVAQFGVVRERIGGALRVNLYSPSVTKFDDAVVTLKGDFPVADEATVVVEAKRPLKLKLRVPTWSGRTVFRTSPGHEVAANENAPWHEMEIPVGTTEVVAMFDMSPRLVESALEPSERRDDFRFKKWASGGKDFAALFRTTPAARLFRGPLLLAKATVVGDDESDILRADMNGGGWCVCLRRIESGAVMGAWGAVFTRGGQEYRTRVCDFASAGDSLLPEGSVAFSIFF